MLTIDNRSQVVVSNLGGDFVLPKDSSKKIAFIAGGIGITPYRGMIKYLSDTKTPQPVTLLYSATSAEDFVYTDVFEEAKQTLGIKTVYTITGANVPAEWRGRTGMVSAEMIQSEIPDYNERLFYISGSQTMVTSVKETLQSLGVTNNHIKGDFFPGYS
jgi:ferredoxin-NADP reductase